MEPADCIIMTERKDAVDFLATRDKIAEATDAAYARGLADGRKEAANIPADTIMLPDGRVVKVLGTLPVTKDNFVVGHGASIWHPHPDDDGVHWVCGELTEFLEYDGQMIGLDAHSASVGGLECYGHPVSECYSTSAAAEAAKEAKPQ